MVPPESPGSVARGRWRHRSQKNDHDPRLGDERGHKTRLTNPLTTAPRSSRGAVLFPPHADPTEVRFSATPRTRPRFGFLGFAVGWEFLHPGGERERARPESVAGGQRYVRSEGLRACASELFGQPPRIRAHPGNGGSGGSADLWSNFRPRRCARGTCTKCREERPRLETLLATAREPDGRHAERHGAPKQRERMLCPFRGRQQTLAFVFEVARR